VSDEHAEGRSDTRHQEPPDTGTEQRETADERGTFTGAPATDRSGGVDAPAGLLDQEEAGRYSRRWDEIQSRFVDQPRESVAAADALVDDVVGAITTRLTDQRGQLEAQWQRDEEVSTEQLRRSLQSYRALFDRLLSAPTGPSTT
jgi:hypothetical protein